MKKINILSIIALTIFTLSLGMPISAEDDVISKEDLASQISEEVYPRAKNISYVTHLFDNPDYLGKKYVYNVEEGVCKKEAFMVNKVQMAINLVGTYTPDPCEQFDIMSYLISQNDNANLEKLIKAGYKPTSITINGRKRRLIHQAILYNNHEALSLLIDAIPLQKRSEILKYAMEELFKQRNYLLPLIQKAKRYYEGHETTCNDIFADVILFNMEGIYMGYENLKEGDNGATFACAMHKLITYRVINKKGPKEVNAYELLTY